MMEETDLLWKKINHLENQMNDIRRATLRAKENPDRTVFASYTSNAQNALATADWRLFNFEDKVYDTHNAVTVGAAWKFTAPVTSTYIAAAGILFVASANWAIGDTLALAVYKNGVLYRRIYSDKNIDANTESWCGGSLPIYLLTNEYISFYVYNGSGGDITASVTAANVWCAICQERFI